MTRKAAHPTGVCQVCGKEKKNSELIPATLIRKSISAVIKKENPEWSKDSYICLDDYRHYREEHIQEMLELERGELSDLDIEVVNSIKQNELLSKNINDEFTKDVTFGERVSDKIAEFGGSWKFIITFSTLIVIWIIFNAFVYVNKAFDPYPFILLNLVLSCLAALQAPIIMMSQNRQEQKDRLRGENDYQVNLKAEMEIRNQNEKIEILFHEWKKLMELQDLQIEFLEELIEKNKNIKTK